MHHNRAIIFSTGETNMNSLHPKALKQTAAQRLNDARQKDQILLIFCGLLFALCVVLTGGSYLLDDMMQNAGGLGAIGKRTMIQTFQHLLPILNLLATTILELGLWNAMLRLSRNQYTSAHSLRMGLVRFFPWLRFLLLQSIALVMITFALMNVAVVIFFALPFSREALELLVPLAMKYTDSNALMEAMMADEALMMTLFDTMIPMYIILVVLVIVVYVPISYRLRVANLIILDDPTAGAFKALAGSIRLTKRNWKYFVKLDLSFWWYYVLLGLSMAVSYLDLLLPMVGIRLPMGATAASLLVYGLYLVSQIAIFYFLRPKVHVSTAVLYDALLPKPQEPQGVVLGNIFQM